jgi:O-antigen ligase
MIANAILLLVAVQQLRGLLPCLLLLVPGLLLTQSRGAIIAAAIGVVVILLMHGFRGRSVPARAVALTLLAAGAFALAPSALQERVTTLSASRDSPAGWNLYFRDQYSEDARRIIREHPWTGVGVGNYLEASSLSALRTSDPHQVILLQAAEGGYVFAASFVFLVVGAMLVLRRTRHVDVGIAAAAVMACTVAHGLVDIYWVRGTPVLSWLLVGMACAGLAVGRQRQ